ncbi:MAG: hypothetical protein ABIT01_17145, partial [Thermoanaerobaculia bacterium]
LRYFWFALWPLSQLAGEGLASLPRHVSRFKIPAFAAAALLLVGVEAAPLAENARSGRVDWRPPVQYLAFQERAGRGGSVVPTDWWSFMCIAAQRMDGGPYFPLEEPSLTPETLEASLSRLGAGWIARATWGGSESRRSLQKMRAWAYFEHADGVALYRFEHGRIVPP